MLLQAASACTGDTRLLYGRPSQTMAVPQPPQQQQQQQHQYAAYGQAVPPAASVQATGYVQPADPRRAVLTDPRLASMQGAPPFLPHTHAAQMAPHGWSSWGICTPLSSEFLDSAWTHMHCSGVPVDDAASPQQGDIAPWSAYVFPTIAIAENALKLTPL